MRIFGVSDRGMVRINNQDSYRFFCEDEKGIAAAVMCDGMGGANGGEIASGDTRDGILREIQRFRLENRVCRVWIIGNIRIHDHADMLSRVRVQRRMCRHGDRRSVFGCNRGADPQGSASAFSGQQ